MRRLIVCCALIAVLALPVTLLAQRPSFEVASVKRNISGGPPLRMGTEGDRFIAENYPVILVLLRAYGHSKGGLLRQHVIGGPAWLDTDRFDVEAKIGFNTTAKSPSEIWMMVQSLLEDRFKLKAHHETRQLPVYNLVVAKGGVKMALSADQSRPDYDNEDDIPYDPSGVPARGEAWTTYTPTQEILLRGTAVPISPDPSTRRPHALPPRGLTTLLSGYVGRLVLDRTKLVGLFDFRLQFSRDVLPGEPSGTSVFTAIQEQLGLKLEPARGPVEVLVIDSIQRPSEN